MNMPRRILHVDDDPQITTLVAVRLEQRGYRSTALNDACQVIQQLRNFHERVLILDVDMPQIDGLDLLKQIKFFDGGIQVVMLTGLVTMTTVLESLRLGAEACLFKPITEIEPLVGAIESCFQKIERWMASLDELSRRRKGESGPVAPAAEVLVAQSRVPAC